jgi:hypothetical protein
MSHKAQAHDVGILRAAGGHLSDPSLLCTAANTWVSAHLVTGLHNLKQDLKLHIHCVISTDLIDFKHSATMLYIHLV